MAERVLSPEEMWLQDSEARLESMEVLLKSVRRDIDALSEKLPSPRPNRPTARGEQDAIVHESGSKDYVVRIDQRPKAYHNLGLGSHTTMEPFDVEEESDKPESRVNLQKSWRSPADFRTNDSPPPSSPTFGESSNIISLNDIILHSVDSLSNSQCLEASRVTPRLGSQHSLPTIEENSQEDNTDTSSISTAEDLKSADYSCEQRFASGVCCAASSDTIIGSMSGETTERGCPRFKHSLTDEAVDGVRVEQAKTTQSPLSRSRSSSPFVNEALKYSCASLRSRESMISETDSFVTVNSQFFPSGEEAYITACSDTDGLADSADEGSVVSQERPRKKMLILQQTPPTDCQNQSDDILEFTLVEATVCRTPVEAKEVGFSRSLDKPTMISEASQKKPVRRRALRKWRTEDTSNEDDGESDTSSSSTCEEAVYDTVTARLVNPATSLGHENSSHGDGPVRNQEMSCISNNTDSLSEEEDIVVHYADENELRTEEVGVERSPISQKTNIPEVGLICHESLLHEDVLKEGRSDYYHPFDNGYLPSFAADANNETEMFTSNSLTISQTDSYSGNDGRQSINPPPFMPRIDLPQRRIDDRSRRARRDYFSCPRSSNTFFMGDTEESTSRLATRQNERPDLPQKSTQRSKSVSRPAEGSDITVEARIGSAGLKETPSDAHDGRMYSRSSSRYRSTDIDVALANTTISRENLDATALNDEGKTKKMASSLFDLSARRQTSMSNNLQFLNGKSTTSLLETDIDTGEQKNQQIILETDVDTLNTYRLVGDFAAADQGQIQSTNDKTYSLFNLSCASTVGQPRQHFTENGRHESRTDEYKRAQSLIGIAKSVGSQRSESKVGASSLVARLRARARSNHELRVAESLTRIHVPEWLDKADLSRPVSPHRTASPSPTRERNPVPRYRTSLPPATTVQSSRTSEHNVKAPMSKTIETVSKPMWPLVPPARTETRRSLRPSQILRERNASSGPRLAPIKSTLRSSMKSHMTEGTEDSPIDRRNFPPTSALTSSSHPIHLTPDDFLTRNEKVWGEKPNSQPPPTLVPTTAASAELVQAPKVSLLSPSLRANPKPLPKSHSLNVQSGHTNGENSLAKSNGYDSNNIKMADSDSMVENEHYQPMEEAVVKKSVNHLSDDGLYEEVQHRKRFVPPPLSVPRPSPSTSLTDPSGGTPNPHSPTWRNADSDGETETAATDGLDNISDLTCLTDLLDKYSTRHLTLLQNRPSALENILAQFGWWSKTPTGDSRHLRGSGGYVAQAAGQFNPEEDDHRMEFFALLTGPAGQGPMILTEYGFDQKRIGLNRNPKDGMLYLQCNNPSCPRMGPTRVDRARSWRTCTNCFTAYCSVKCREQAIPTHNMVCNFGRVRLACGRILHHLAPSQQTSLTALAKAGATRLGRGGILIAFASVQDAEFFLARSAELPLRQPQALTETTPANRPSPSGLIAPPIYLTVEELSKLDSKLAAPCKFYKPSVSYVLLVIVCAYDLEMMKNGRAVHLYKQCIILPFPTTTALVTPPTQKKLPLPTETVIPRGQAQNTKEERESYSKRLQRTLRERGVSLRNSEPEVYKRLSTFVETGEAFEPVEFDFHDYYTNQVITCTISPMKDVVIRQKKELGTKASFDSHQVKGYPKKTYKMPRPRIGETEL